MSRPDDFSDTNLSAWLDGELDAERRALVDAWLREHPEAAARARLWAADRDAVRARFNPVLSEPVPPALVREVWHTAAPARWPAARAAVAAGLLVAGALIGAGGMWQSGAAARRPAGGRLAGRLGAARRARPRRVCR